MKRKERPKFPIGFFEQPRPTISSEEALKDIIPVQWTKEVIQGTKKALVKSIKEIKDQPITR